MPMTDEQLRCLTEEERRKYEHAKAEQWPDDDDMTVITWAERIAALRQRVEELREQITNGRSAHNDDRVRADTLWRERDALRQRVAELEKAIQTLEDDATFGDTLRRASMLFEEHDKLTPEQQSVWAVWLRHRADMVDSVLGFDPTERAALAARPTGNADREGDWRYRVGTVKDLLQGQVRAGVNMEELSRQIVESLATRPTGGEG